VATMASRLPVYGGLHDGGTIEDREGYIFPYVDSAGECHDHPAPGRRLYVRQWRPASEGGEVLIAATSCEECGYIGAEAVCALCERLGHGA
jgi:hypothetical protein